VKRKSLRIECEFTIKLGESVVGHERERILEQREASGEDARKHGFACRELLKDLKEHFSLEERLGHVPDFEELQGHMELEGEHLVSGEQLMKETNLDLGGDGCEEEV